MFLILMFKLWDIIYLYERTQMLEYVKVQLVYLDSGMERAR